MAILITFQAGAGQLSCRFGITVFRKLLFVLEQTAAATVTDIPPAARNSAGNRAEQKEHRSEAERHARGELHISHDRYLSVGSGSRVTKVRRPQGTSSGARRA